LKIKILCLNFWDHDEPSRVGCGAAGRRGRRGTAGQLVDSSSPPARWTLPAVFPQPVTL